MPSPSATATRRRTTTSKPKVAPAAEIRGGQLPDSSPKKFEDLMALMDQAVDENVDIFIQRGQDYRQRRRDGSERPLTALEASQIAAATLSEEPVEELAARYQESGLKVRDEATPAEFLFAGGLATAPAFMALVHQFIVLAEMPGDQHEELSRSNKLAAHLQTEGETLSYKPTKAVRARAVAALEHFGAESGVGSGKGVGVLAKMALQVITESLGHLTTSELVESASTSLISSDASTAGP